MTPHFTVKSNRQLPISFAKYFNMFKATKQSTETSSILWWSTRREIFRPRIVWSQRLASGFISNYIKKILTKILNTKCWCVCLSVLGHLESDWDTLWHKVAFRPRMGSKRILLQKKFFFVELLPFFYISLRFLCKFEERL